MSVTSVATHAFRRFTLWITRNGILTNTDLNATFVARVSTQMQSYRDTWMCTLVTVHISVIFVARHIHLKQIWWGISEPTTQTQVRIPSVISVRPAASLSHTNALYCFIFGATLGRATFFVMCVVKLSRAMKHSELTVGFTLVKNQMCAPCVVKHSVRRATWKCTNAHTLVSGPIAVINVERHSHSAQRSLFISVTTRGRDHTNVRSVARVLCPKLCLKHIKLPTMSQTPTTYSNPVCIFRI